MYRLQVMIKKLRKDDFKFVSFKLFLNLIVTDEDDCMTTGGKQCIIPFNTKNDNNYYRRNKCFWGKCATRLNSDGTAKEEGQCRPGCPGSNNNIIYSITYCYEHSTKSYKLIITSLPV